jgi:hypothetical protein
MEALLEKEGTVEKRNDERLDELSGRVDAGFKEMRQGFVDLNTRLDRMATQMATRDDLRYLSSRIDKLMFGLLAGCAGIIGTLVAVATT